MSAPTFKFNYEKVIDMKSQDYTILYVNPVPRTSAQGRHLQQYVVFNSQTGEVEDRVPMNKQKEDSVPENYSFFIDYQRNKVVTGLNVTVDNPFYEAEVQDVMTDYNLSNQWREILEKVVEKPKITKQMYFEILASVEPGTYHDDVTSPTIFNSGPTTKFDDEKASFLQKFNYTLYARSNRIAGDTPRGRLIIQAIRHNPLIAQSRDQINSAVHKFYVSEEFEEERIKNNRKKKLKKAMASLFNLESQGDNFLLYKIASVVKNGNGDVLVKGQVSADRVEAALNTYLDQDNASLSQNIENFLDVTGLLETADGKMKLDVMFMVQQALNNNILTARDGVIRWNSKHRDGAVNVSEFKDYDKLIAFLLKEYKAYNEGDDEVTNWYAVMKEECESNGIKFE